MKHPLLPLTLALFLTTCNNQPTTQTQGKIMITPCQNLYKVETVDDLLKQFYDNIDSHCLFEMDTAELEKIWGIRVFNEASTNTNDMDRYAKEAFGFFITKSGIGDRSYFQVTSTKNARNSGLYWGDAKLSQGKLVTLPSYDVQVHIETVHTQLVTQDKAKARTDIDFPFAHSDYVWLNHKKSVKYPFLVLHLEDIDTPSSIFFYQNAMHHKPYRRLYFGSWF